MRPRLSELSQITGLSMATVSRVLNGRPGVAPSTRRRVLDVAGELGYRDTQPQQRTGLVGVVIPELENPIFPALAQAMEARLARRGLITVVCPSTPETVNEEDYLEVLRNSGTAGVIVVNGRFSQIDFGFQPYSVLRDAGIPVVLVNGMGPESPLPAVAVDIQASASTAVRHLGSLGHRQIGCLIGPGRYWTSKLLAAGWSDGMVELGQHSRDDLVSESLFSYEGGRAGTPRLLESGVSAVVAGSDLMALGAIAAIRSWELQVPKDVSVVGFDGTAMVNYTDPPLTTIRQPVGRMASTAVELLVDQMYGRSGGGLHSLQAELVVRASTGLAPGG